ESAAAVSIDDGGGNSLVEPGREDGPASDAALILDRFDDTEDDVFDEAGVEPRSGSERSKRRRGELDRRYFVQRAVRLAPSPGGPDRVEDECLGHGFRSVRATAETEPPNVS